MSHKIAFMCSALMGMRFGNGFFIDLPFYFHSNDFHFSTTKNTKPVKSISNDVRRIPSSRESAFYTQRNRLVPLLRQDFVCIRVEFAFVLFLLCFFFTVLKF
ncbi:hypothetical protein DQK91_18740 [Oceanidesulfovibrio marinus]|uniref:Uncharacterized protein n=1 Tax=Oceanidesulfovibrio marinus TaxID=370038 RepID=A0A6P1ZCC1_9BACT|nr:hypothetical protein DQK91_18740 [Oceanidesulfovibrio marinus]